MRSTSDLHELIHALSPSEKRYFRIFASRHVHQGQNNYMRIFDMVEGQTEHDEPALLAGIDDPKLKAQFAVQKNYLHKLILKSLRNYHADISVDFKLKEWMMNVELLLRKGLVKQSQKQLAKAEQVALEHERYEVTAEIAGYKMLMLMKDSKTDLDRVERKLQDTLAQSGQQFERLKNILAFRTLSMKMLMMNRRDPQAQTHESKAAYAEIMDDPLMQDKGNALSKRAELYFLQSHFVSHFAQSDFAKAFEVTMQIVDLMESHPHLVFERPENYVIVLQNAVMMSTFTQPLEVSRQLIARLVKFGERFPDARFDDITAAKVPVWAANIEIRLLMNHHLYDEAAVCLVKALSYLESGYSYNVNDGYVLIDLYFAAARIHLLKRQYRQALSYVTKLMHMEGLNAEFEYFLDTRMIHIVILFETGENELLESALASLHRYLQQKRKLFQFEKTLLEFIRKASADLPDISRRQQLLQLRAELQRLDGTKEGGLSIPRSDILQWLDDRLGPE